MTPWVYRLALIVAGMTVLVMFAGAKVTSTNSGMAFTTWPDAYGRWLWPDNPTLDGILEHSHRLLGAGLGLCAILLVVCAWLQDRRPIMRKSAAALLGLIILQGLLGGYRVLLDEMFPVVFPILHGTLAHVVFALAGFVAYVASLAYVPCSIEDGGQVRTARKLAVIALVTVFVQVTLGVVFRHGEGDFEGWATIAAVTKWTHVSFAAVAGLLVLIAAAYSLGKFGRIPGFTRTNRIILAILFSQMLLGFIALVIQKPKTESDTSLMLHATLISLHVVVGASLMLAMTVLVARSYRNLVPRPEA